MPQAILDQLMPWSVFVNPLFDDSVIIQGALAGFSSAAGAGGMFGGGAIYNGGGVQNDEFGWDLALGKGTWNLQLTFSRDTNRAIATFLLDGSSIGTLDLYGTAQVNTTAKITGFNVPTNGKHRLTMKAATRNPSNTTGYFLTAQMLKLRRTA